MKWNEGGSGEFERPPAGSHLARCYAIIDLGTSEKVFNGKAKNTRDVRLMFELPYELMEGRFVKELAGKPFSVPLTCTMSLNEKSKLYKLVTGWRGKKMTADEIKHFNPVKLIGQPCRITLIESESGYMNIDSIAPANSKEQKEMPTAKNTPLFFSLEPTEFTKESWDRLNSKTQEKIIKTPEYAAIQNPISNEVDYSASDSSPDHPDHADTSDIPF